MRAIRLLVSVVLLLAASACKDAAPVHRYLELGDGCQGTEAGKACIAMMFDVTPDVRRAIPAPIVARLSWALYHNGDVSLLGPGDNQPVYSGNVPDVSFTDPASTFMIHVPNVAAGDYQALAYLDLNGNLNADSGEPVTFPGDGFRVKAEVQTQVEVDFDYIR